MKSGKKNFKNFLKIRIIPIDKQKRICYDLVVNKNCSYLGGMTMEKTKQFRKRNAILTYLQSTKSHPSAEMVFAGLKPEIPDLSMGTVYRNLSLFKQQGLASSVATVKGVERFDGNVAPHVHFICEDCDAVIDLPQLQVPQQLRRTAAEQVGGTVRMCQLSFSGVCRNCMENQQKGGESA